MKRVATKSSRSDSASVSRLLALFLLPGVAGLAGLMAGCGKKASEPGPPVETPASPAATATPAAPLSPAGPDASLAGEEEEVERPRPTVLVFVEGGPDDHTIWRGWPVLVQAAVLQGERTADLKVNGPSKMAPERRGDLWVIPPAASAQLTPGTYTFTVGAGSTEAVVLDPPRPLAPGNLAILRRISVRVDLALGNTDAARRTAQEWAAAEPKSQEAHTVLGDALRAMGDRSGAAAAYDEAIRLIPRGVRPPGSLYARAGELLREEAAAPPATPTGLRNRDDDAFFALIDAGDAALAAGDCPEAARRYAAAGALHRDKHLTITRSELEAKQAALGASSAGPMTTPVAVQAAPCEAAAASPNRPVEPTALSSSAPGVVVPAAELVDATICADASGQWAVSATAGSQYGKAQYSPAQATGVPNIPLGMAGNSPDAWCPAGKTAGTDWLEVAFAKPVHATEVRVRQNNAPGAIAKIEALEPDGTAHLWWEGVDPFVAPRVREIAWFAVRVPQTSYLVAKVKITLNLAAVPDWKEIDAVQLVGATE